MGFWLWLWLWQCEEVFEGLLQHGRLSVNQIADRHKETSSLDGGKFLVYVFIVFDCKVILILSNPHYNLKADG